MGIRLPRLPRSVAIADRAGLPTRVFQQWVQDFAQGIEAQEARQDEAIALIQAAQAAATAAQTAADAAMVAAETAQSAADAAQQAVNDLDLPSSGSRTVTADGNLDEFDSVVLADASAAPITLLLPDAFQFEGQITVRKIDATANSVTIEARGTDLINGGATVTITTQYDGRAVTSDGSNAWFA